MNNHSAAFLKEDPWRIFRIMAEFVDSFEMLSRVSPAVTVFGSARMPRSNPYYRMAVTLGKELAKQNLAVITGGGPGIMEAANRGAADAGGKSIGLCIQLPHEQGGNPHISPELNFNFHYFFMRKLWFTQLAKALVVFPGGFGTMDELWEMLTLLQTGKMQRRNLILIYGRRYWNEVLNWRAMMRWGTIRAQEYDVLQFADTVDEAFERVKTWMEKYHLEPGNEWLE